MSGRGETCGTLQHRHHLGREQADRAQRLLESEVAKGELADEVVRAGLVHLLVHVLGNVFGGVVLSMMDTTAAVSAIRHARRICVTVSVDRVDFREPIHVGELLIMKSSVNYVGKTSMEVGVRVEAENLLTGVRLHTNSCYLTFVAVDASGKPMPVPPLTPETPEELRRYEAARSRRERRLHERIFEEGQRR